jgi:hypothetical protein
MLISHTFSSCPYYRDGYSNAVFYRITLRRRFDLLQPAQARGRPEVESSVIPSLMNSKFSSSMASAQRTLSAMSARSALFYQIETLIHCGDFDPVGANQWA